MELAVHLRDVPQRDDLSDISRHLREFLFDSADAALSDIGHLSQITRIYLGDEFCFNRLPLLPELDSLLDLAESNQKSVTLLTPPLTDHEIERCVPLFDHTGKQAQDAEIVVNDLGVLRFLKKHYPHFRLAAGRLLNKGFKDPRLTSKEQLPAMTAEFRDLLYNCTFRHPLFQQKMLELGVSRLEMDLLPHGQSQLRNEFTLPISVYFPFGYVTTGRVCPLAASQLSEGESFIPLDNCIRPCARTTFQLKSTQCSPTVVQSGNTVFYEYTQSMMASLLQIAGSHGLRLVYQGVAMAS